MSLALSVSDGHCRRGKKAVQLHAYQVQLHLQKGSNILEFYEVLIKFWHSKTMFHTIGLMTL